MYGSGLGAVIASDKNPGTENGAMMLLAVFCVPINFILGGSLGTFISILISKFVESLKLKQRFL